MDILDLVVIGKAPSPLRSNVVSAIGNCALYLGPWGVRSEEHCIGVCPEGAIHMACVPLQGNQQLGCRRRSMGQEEGRDSSLECSRRT